jgi:hypothetical protein
MLKKTLMVATLGTALAAGTLSTTASAQGDPLLGALVGGGIGAAIGHSVNGHNGAMGRWGCRRAGGRQHRRQLRVLRRLLRAGYARRRPVTTLRQHPTTTTRRRSYVAPPVVVYRPRPVLRALRITTGRVTTADTVTGTATVPTVTRTRTRTRDTDPFEFRVARTLSPVIRRGCFFVQVRAEESAREPERRASRSRAPISSTRHGARRFPSRCEAQTGPSPFVPGIR